MNAVTKFSVEVGRTEITTFQATSPALHTPKWACGLVHLVLGVVTLCAGVLAARLFPFLTLGKEIMSEQNETETQAVVLKSPNSISLTLGIIGVVLGVVALLGAWVPVIGLAIIPASVIGFLLSLAGVIFACFKKYKSIGLSILGCILCVTAITLSICSTYAAAKAVQRAAKMAQDEERRQEQAAELERQQAAAKEAKDRADEIVSLKSELVGLNNELPAMQIAFDKSSSNRESVQAQYEKFMSEKPYLTNVVYLKIQHQLNLYEQQKYANEQSIASIRSSLNGTANTYNRSTASTAGPAMAALRNQQEQNLQVAEQNVEILSQNIETASGQLQDIVDTANKFQDDKFQKANQEYQSAADALNGLKGKIESEKTQISTLQP
jgi:hypothetical protein